MGFSVQSHRLVTKYASTSSSMPTTSNTGPRNTLTLFSGDKVLTSGQSASNLHITGDLYLAGPSVSATDCQVDGQIKFNSAPGGNYGNPNPWTNQSIDYCYCGTIGSTGCDTATINHTRVSSALSGNRDTLCAFLNSAGPPVKNLTITNSLFGDLATTGATTGHWEALHISVCQTGLIQNNVFDWTSADATTLANTSTVMNIDNPGAQPYPTGTGSSNMTIDGNWFYGGVSNQVYLFLSGTSSVTNNKFSTPPSTTQFSDANSSTFHFTQSGNTLDGAPYSLPYS